MTKTWRVFFTTNSFVMPTEFKRQRCRQTLAVVDNRRLSSHRTRIMQKLLILFLLLLPHGLFGQSESPVSAKDSLDKLANDFWIWRAKYAPFTADDVNRLERPGGVRDWSAAAIDKRTRDLKEFDALYQKIEPKGLPVQL